MDLLPPTARIVYVTPSHQYPLGMTMSTPRRRALLRWAQRHDAAVIEDGLLDKHIRRSRRGYAERYHILAEALAGPLADHLTARAPNAGLHVAAVLREGLSEDEVLQDAAGASIAVSGLRDCFHAGPAQPGLLIGFGAVSAADLPAALRMLDYILAR
ncbi:MAG: hypothetical protein ACRDPY_16080 [Streptosporangiaceae bacterium]